MNKDENHIENSISVDKIISMIRTVTPNTFCTFHAKSASALSEIQQYIEREKNNGHSDKTKTHKSTQGPQL